MGILFGPIALWISREGMMSETSVELVGVIKNESIFIPGKKPKKTVIYLYLTEDWISSAIVQTYLLNALAIAFWFDTVVLLLIMTLEQVVWTF